MRRAAALILVAALAGGLAACSADPLAEAYRNGDSKGYIAGEFQVVTIPEKDRGEPVEFSGRTDAGDAVTNGDYAGDVLVVNFWYAACGPCRVEAPFLEQVNQEYEGKGARFLGVNTYDQAPQAQAFAEKFGVSYPSVIAVNDGRVKLAFAEATPIQATPTTLVLDRKGRVAARIIGQLESASVLSTLVRETLAETS